MSREPAVVIGGWLRFVLYDHVDGMAVTLVPKFRRELFCLGSSYSYQSEDDDDESGFGSHGDFLLLLHPL